MAVLLLIMMLAAWQPPILSMPDHTDQQDDSSCYLSRRLLQVPRFGPRWPWQFNAVTRYISTPTAAGSFTLAGDAKGETFVDGTVKTGLGFSTSTAVAVGRSTPGLDAIGLTTPRYDRPFVATQAYVTVPRLLGWTTFPTIGYGLAEGRGSVLSASNGYFVIGEVAYNALSNSFGLSLSQAQSGSLSYPAAIPGNGLLGGQGFSGMEQIGGANSLTLLTDPRTIQFAQGIAYPFNILTPGNPLTCTQTMINTAVSTWGDLGGPVRPTPRSQPVFLIPFCLEFFNWNVLDNFHMFLQDYLDYYYGYDQAYYEDYGLPGDLPSQARGPGTSEPGPPHQSRRNATGLRGAPDLTANATGNPLNTTGPSCRRPDTTTPFLKSVAIVQQPYPAIQPTPVDDPYGQQGSALASAQQQQQQQLAVTSRPPMLPPGRGMSILPSKFAANTLTKAGFGGSTPGLDSLNMIPQAPEQPNVASGAGAQRANDSKDSLPICPAPPPKSNLSLGINGTSPGPTLMVARPPGQIFPLAFRSSPQPRTQDINALVVLGQLVAQQVQQLPAGRLNRGAADQFAKAVDSVAQATSAEVGQTVRQAWDVTNQIARLGAQVALNTFLSGAGAILPWTRNLYNTSSSWYRAAAASSNHAVDGAIAEMTGEQDVIGNLTATLASAIQELTLRMALGSAKTFNDENS